MVVSVTRLIAIIRTRTLVPTIMTGDMLRSRELIPATPTRGRLRATSPTVLCGPPSTSVLTTCVGTAETTPIGRVGATGQDFGKAANGGQTCQLATTQRWPLVRCSVVQLPESGPSYEAEMVRISVAELI